MSRLAVGDEVTVTNHDTIDLFTHRSRNNAVTKTRHYAGFAFLKGPEQRRHNAAPVVFLRSHGGIWKQKRRGV